jgi:hypothetical protein
MNEASCHFAAWRTAHDVANQRVRSEPQKTLSVIQNSPGASMLPGMAETRVFAVGANGGKPNSEGTPLP